jgi:hypothetical protein
LLRSPFRLLVALGACLVALPAAAQAAQINGDPLHVSSNEDGRLGVAFAHSQTPEFCCSSVVADTGEVTPGNAGFKVSFINPSNSTAPVFGAGSGGVPPASGPTVSGSGSAEDPYKLRTTWHYQSDQGYAFDIRQELTYANGDQHFTAHYDVVNVGVHPLPFRASLGADLLGGGSDSGIGLFQAGPPRFIAGFNNSVGSVAGISEVTPWTHFEEGQYGDVLSRASGDPRDGQNLNDTINTNLVDNGAAVQWDAYVTQPLAPGATTGFEAVWRFKRTFGLTPETAALTTGDITPFEVSTFDTSGNPQRGALVRWTSVGVNNLTGSVRTGADGKALIEYAGANPGSDFVTVYVDSNSNDTRDADEPQRQATVSWLGPDAPAFAKEVNVKPVSGTVLIKLPRGAKVKGKWAQSAQQGFVRLTEAQQIPVGAQMDASRGRVQMTSSKGAASPEVQSAQFYSGRFQVLQPRKENGITEMRMTGALSCSKGKLAPAAARSRRLWGNGKGRFRTRGRNSSATVRGTTWLQKDTCTTTTTTVKKGVVIVKDFAKRKNVRVKAGKRYVARAKRR